MIIQQVLPPATGDALVAIVLVAGTSLPVMVTVYVLDAEAPLRHALQLAPDEVPVLYDYARLALKRRDLLSQL